MAITTPRAKALSATKVLELTTNELALIKQLCMADKVIAQNLGIDIGAVKMRISRLATKFGVENRTVIIVKALKLGLVTTDELVYREHHG